MFVFYSQCLNEQFFSIDDLSCFKTSHFLNWFCDFIWIFLVSPLSPDLIVSWYPFALKRTILFSSIAWSRLSWSLSVYPMNTDSFLFVPWVNPRTAIFCLADPCPWTIYSFDHSGFPHHFVQAPLRLFLEWSRFCSVLFYPWSLAEVGLLNLEFLSVSAKPA